MKFSTGWKKKDGGFQDQANKVQEVSRSLERVTAGKWLSRSQVTSNTVSGREVRRVQAVCGVDRELRLRRIRHETLEIRSHEVMKQLLEGTKTITSYTVTFMKSPLGN